MADWTEGYVADIDYAFSYCQELNPSRANLALLGRGIVPPKIETACELGFGQGLGTVMHAAGSAVEWHGTDFNPAHASFAREMAAAAGVDAGLHDDAFEDYCNRSDLPDFDFIGMHGIWSWVSDHNRAVIVDFIRRKLKPGGLVYMGYNSAAGWASFVPMREMMKRYAEGMMPQSLSGIDRINVAVKFAEKFLAANPMYAELNPAVADRLAKITGQDRHYLAHEFFCQDWHPMHFSQMPDLMAPAKVSFACSARYLDQVDAVNLETDHITFLNEIPDPIFRENVRDMMIARRFRYDYWVKGVRNLALLEHTELLRRQRVLLLNARSNVSMTLQGALREVEMQDSVYGPILDALADQTPKSIAEIEDAVRDRGIVLVQLLQAILVLAGGHLIASVQDEETIARAKPQTDRLNRYLTTRACDNADIAYLASPVTGGGIAVGRIPQMFLSAQLQGHKQPVDWVEMVWPILAAQGQMIVKDGKALESKEENCKELLLQANAFAEDQIPILKALQVV